MDIWSKEKRSQVMSKIRSKNTKPEIMLRKALFAEGYRFRIHYNKLPGKPDIVFPKYKLAIFVHGCFLHYHETCPEGRIPSTNSKFWKEKLSKNIDRDKKHNASIQSSGWTVVTIWECELNKSISDVIEYLKPFLS